MGNPEIEKAGIEAVIKYEKSYGRKPVKNSGGKGYGFDIETIDAKSCETRKIEIKSTSKNEFNRRWLEPLEHQALQKNDDFWLYLVVNALIAPKIFTYPKPELIKKYKGDQIKHVYSFSKKEFKD